jgi:hypothetical protein
LIVRFDLLTDSEDALEKSTDSVLDLLEDGSIESDAQLSICIHFCPAISTPFAPCHVDHEVTVELVVVKPFVDGLRHFLLFDQLLLFVRGFDITRSRWEGVDLSLVGESNMRPQVWLRAVQVLERICACQSVQQVTTTSGHVRLTLLLVLPFHVLLFVEHRIPPYIEQTLGELGSPYEE